MKPTREPRLDRLDGQLMPEALRPYFFLPEYFAALRDGEEDVDLWTCDVISRKGLRRSLGGGMTDSYIDKLMDCDMHNAAFREAVEEGLLENGDDGVPFRALVEWGLSKGYVPRASLYSALYAKEPNWRDLALSVSWRVLDAVYYVLGRAPLRDTNLLAYELSSCGFIDEECLFSMTNRAIEIGELPAWQETGSFENLEWHVSPKDFCLWFKEKGLFLPDPLDRFVEGTFFLAKSKVEQAIAESPPSGAGNKSSKMEFSLTVSAAARRLRKELDDTISPSGAKSEISKKCDQRVICSEGTGPERRINEDSLNSFILYKRNQRLQEDN